MLVLAVAAIMFGSLVLTKMDCNRVANYFLLPVLLGLGYLNVIHYHRKTVVAQQRLGNCSDQQDNKRADDGTRTEAAISLSGSDANSLADTIELFLCNRLAVMSLVHLVTNLFSEQIAVLIK